MKKQNDLIIKLGYLALATRFKRISENLMSDVSKLYKEHHLNFEARWFTLLHLLNSQNETTVVDAAVSLGLSHPAIIQLVEQMEKLDLISSEQGRDDKRKRMLMITESGKQVFKEIQPLLKKIERANKQLAEESGMDVLKCLDAIEELLRTKSMFERVNEVDNERRKK